MKKYFSDILSEIQANLNARPDDQAFARISKMVIAPGDETDAAEMFAQVYLTVARRLAAKLGVHIDSDDALWFLFQRVDREERVFNYCFCIEVTRRLLLQYHLFAGQRSESFEAICCEMCTESGRQQLASVFSVMEYSPSLIRHPVQQGSLDARFNDLCMDTASATEDRIAVFVEELSQFTQVGAFDGVKELLGLRQLTYDGLAEYIKTVIKAYGNPTELYGEGSGLIPVPNEGVVGNLVHYIWHTQNMPADVSVDMD